MGVLGGALVALLLAVAVAVAVAEEGREELLAVWAPGTAAWP